MMDVIEVVKVIRFLRCHESENVIPFYLRLFTNAFLCENVHPHWTLRPFLILIVAISELLILLFF